MFFDFNTPDTSRIKKDVDQKTEQLRPRYEQLKQAEADGQLDEAGENELKQLRKLFDESDGSIF